MRQGEGYTAPVDGGTRAFRPSGTAGDATVGVSDTPARGRPRAMLSFERLSALPADRPGSGRNEQGASHRKEWNGRAPL